MTRKQKLIVEASGLGLSTTGTANEIEDRINAFSEAENDTAQALQGLTSVVSPKQPMRVHPMNAALFGGAIGAALHFIG